MTAPPSRMAHALGGIGWGGAAMAASMSAQIGFTVVMARLLEPAAFGLMALAMVVLRLATFLSQGGIAAAIVQRVAHTEAHVEAGVGASLVVAGTAAVVLVVGAGAAAELFAQPALTPVLQVLAVSLPIAALASLPIALLRRSLRFRAIAGIETGAYVLGYGAVGLALAWRGAGVWALVGATIAHQGLTWALAYAVRPHSLRPRLGPAARELLRYGSRHMLVGLLEFLSANLTSAVIGRLAGLTALGLFNRAWLLANLPVEKASTVISRVLFPLLSQIQHDMTRRADVFVLAISAIGLLAIAISAAMAAAAGQIVAVLLGPQWRDAVPLVEALAWSVPPIFMASVAGTVCDALAMLRLKLRVQIGALVVSIALLIGLHGHGLQGYAWAFVIAESLRLAAFLPPLVRDLALPRRDLLASLGSVAATGATSYGLTHLVLQATPAWSAAAHLAATAACAAAALVLGIATWLLSLRASGAAALAVRALRHRRRAGVHP